MKRIVFIMDTMLQVLRKEKKFLLPIDRYYALADQLSRIMQEDGNNQGDGYTIRSLYFDTPEEKDYADKEDGVEVRRKIRLRTYGNGSEIAKLEMKQKQGDNQLKRSLTMKREDASQIIKGDYGVLLSYGSAFAAELYSLMRMLCYIPRTVVEYKRRAYVAKENAIRITFDHHIIATEGYYDIFDDAIRQYPVWDPYLVVLEVKYNGFLLGYIKDLLHDMTGSELSVSKYCLARSVGMHYSF